MWVLLLGSSVQGQARTQNTTNYVGVFVGFIVFLMCTENKMQAVKVYNFTCPSLLQPQAYTSPVEDKASTCSQPTAMSSMNIPSRDGTTWGLDLLFSIESGKPIRHSEARTKERTQ